MTLLIKDLFTKPVDRPINGVIKADQDDPASVWQELDEYVVTKELDIHFRQFFGRYLDAIDNASDPQVAGKVGVWISGFFGSGKSHFLKILSYLLENRAVSRDIDKVFDAISMPSKWRRVSPLRVTARFSRR